MLFTINQLCAQNLPNHFHTLVPAVFYLFLLSNNIPVFSSIKTNSANTVFTMINLSQQSFYLNFAIQYRKVKSTFKPT